MDLCPYNVRATCVRVTSSWGAVDDAEELASRCGNSREGGDPVSLLLIQEKKPVDDQRFALLKDSFRFRGNDGAEASRSTML